MTHKEANEKGFGSVEEMLQLEGAWSIGWCCFDHMVHHLDNGPTNRPIVRDENCYKRERRTQAEGQARYRAQTRPPLMEYVQPIIDRAPATKFVRRRHQKENQPLPGKPLKGTALEQAVRKHKKSTRDSFLLLDTSGRTKVRKENANSTWNSQLLQGSS
jgi:hypothetical protein